MFELAKKICFDIPKMKECEYKFYRGSEWLIWFANEDCEDGYISWEIYRTGYFVSLNKIQHLESEFKAVTLERKTYYLDENLEEIMEYESSLFKRS